MTEKQDIDGPLHKLPDVVLRGVIRRLMQQEPVAYAEHLNLLIDAGWDVCEGDGSISALLVEILEFEVSKLPAPLTTLIWWQSPGSDELKSWLESSADNRANSFPELESLDSGTIESIVVEYLAEELMRLAENAYRQHLLDEEDDFDDEDDEDWDEDEDELHDEDLDDDSVVEASELQMPIEKKPVNLDESYISDACISRIGWSITLSRQCPDTSRTDLKEIVLAHWETGMNGLDWIDDLVTQKKAIRTRADGYPSTYMASAAVVFGQIVGGPPRSTGAPTFGDDYYLPGGWTGKFQAFADRIKECPSDEMIEVEAWDLS